MGQSTNKKNSDIPNPYSDFASYLKDKNIPEEESYEAKMKLLE